VVPGATAFQSGAVQASSLRGGCIELKNALDANDQ
jgi:hypothetical protein